MKKKRLTKSVKTPESETKSLCGTHACPSMSCCYINNGTGNDSDILF